MTCRFSLIARWLSRFALWMAILAAPVYAQTQILLNPDCSINFTFTASGQFTPSSVVNCTHNLSGIVQWTMSYQSQGFSGVSIVVQSAPDVAGAPGSWGTFSGTVTTGTNPLTSTAGGYVQLKGYNPWNRVFLTTATGVGTITGTLYGCRQPGCGGSSSSGSLGTLFYQTVQQAGVSLPQEPVLNFPSNVTCVDNPGNMSTDCTPTGGGSGSQADILNDSRPPGVVGQEVHKNLAILAGATATILSTVSGSGYVSELFIASNKYTTEVIVTVDGEGTPQIDANIADLVGDNYVDSQPAFFGNWISGSNGTAGNPAGTLRIPIPFSSSVLIQVKNNAVATATITSHVIYHTGITDNWPLTQHLHLAVVGASGITANTETDMLNVSAIKPGKLMGFGWIYDGFPGSVMPATAGLEGAFKVYVDGSGTPSLATGGSEDLFGMPFYFANTGAFGTGVNNTLAPSSTDIALTVKTSVTWGAQRFFVKDPIPFTNALRVTWTCGNTAAVGFTGTCTLKSSVYYYTQN